MPLESQTQNKIINHLKKQWYHPIKIIKVNGSWYPDLFVLTWNGKHIWIEVKQLTWKLSEIQKYRISELEKLWDRVIVAYGFNDYIEKVKNYI